MADAVAVPTLDQIRWLLDWLEAIHPDTRAIADYEWVVGQIRDLLHGEQAREGGEG